MESQTDGLLIQRALRQFSPDIFLHPVWIRFAASIHQSTARQIQPLLQAQKQMLAVHDLPGACSVLFLCAARQSWLGDFPAAQECLSQVLKLGKRHHLPDVVIWGYWGASAICAQQGDFQRAVDYLHSLHAVLKTNDWVLADLVEMITQYLERMPASPPGSRVSAGMSQPTNPFLQPVLYALFQWGEVPDNRAVPSPSSAAPIQAAPSGRWRQAWQGLLRWVRGDSQPEKAWPVPGNGHTQPIPPASLVPVSGGNHTAQDRTVSITLPLLEDAQEAARQTLPETYTNGAGSTALSPVPENGLYQQSGSTPPVPAAIPPVPYPQEPRAPAKPSLAIYFFGAFRLYQDDQLVSDWPSQKSVAILKYLTANRGKPVAKDVLMDYFWADAETEVARRNLHQAIYALRQVLKRGWPNFPSILFENDCYVLNPNLELWLDFEAFDAHIQAARRLEEAGSLSQAVVEYSIAQELYPGDFLEDDLYEDWPNAQRTYYRTIYMDLLNRLCEHYIQQQQYYPAIILCQKILAKDNCSEQAYRNLIQCYLAQGQRQLAIREYQTCVQTLKQELNLAPSKETRAIYALITTSQDGTRRGE